VFKAPRFSIRVESAWLQRFKVICNKLLSDFAASFNLRRYSEHRFCFKCISVATLDDSLHGGAVQVDRV